MSASVVSENYELRRGTILRERYEVFEAIGSGGFGITYRAFDQLLNRFVAVKEFYIARWMVRGKNGNECMVAVTGADDRDQVKRCRLNFLREAQIMEELKDIPYLSRIQERFAENNTEYIVMKLQSGKSLKEYSDRKKKLSVGELFPMLEQILFALERMHRKGFIHRDICPGNLIRTEDGDLFLIDFGAATACDKDSVLWNEQVFTHKAFNAPEHLDFSEQGPWTDIYSLCATAVYLLTGEMIPEWEERRKNDRVPEILMKARLTAGQQNALMKGLFLNQKQRYLSAEKLRAALCGESVSPLQEWKVCYAARTDIGSRAMNQDNLTVDGLFSYSGTDFERTGEYICHPDELHLAAVCDGVGGAHSGELASRTAVQALAHFAEQYRCSGELPERLIDEFLDQLNEKILILGAKIGTVATTLSVLFWKGNHYWCVNIGDSPIYLLRKRKLTRLSVPQTLAHVRMVEGMAVSPSDLHTLVNYIGKEKTAGSQMAAIRHGHLQEGDIFLICSDGVTDVVDEERLRRGLLKGERKGMDHIYQVLARRGKKDNCSTIIVKF